VWRDDLRDSIRFLREDLRGTLLAVSLQAVTIGAITAIYAMVHAVVLRPFAFVDQDRLTMTWQRDDRRALPVIEVAYGNMTDWLARSRSLRAEQGNREYEIGIRDQGPGIRSPSPCALNPAP
jgi:hypothetical protein